MRTSCSKCGAAPLDVRFSMRLDWGTKPAIARAQCGPDPARVIIFFEKNYPPTSSSIEAREHIQKARETFEKLPRAMCVNCGKYSVVNSVSSRPVVSVNLKSFLQNAKDPVERMAKTEEELARQEFDAYRAKVLQQMAERAAKSLATKTVKKYEAPIDADFDGDDDDDTLTDEAEQELKEARRILSSKSAMEQMCESVRDDIPGDDDELKNVPAILLEPFVRAWQKEIERRALAVIEKRLKRLQKLAGRTASPEPADTPAPPLTKKSAVPNDEPGQRRIRK